LNDPSIVASHRFSGIGRRLALQHHSSRYWSICTKDHRTTGYSNGSRYHSYHVLLVRVPRSCGQRDRSHVTFSYIHRSSSVLGRHSLSTMQCEPDSQDKIVYWRTYLAGGFWTNSMPLEMLPLRPS
jgi:hypothetical protein